MLSVEDAQAFLQRAAKKIDQTETLDLLSANGRVLARDLISPLDLPAQDCSAMDGYAVRAEEARAGARLPVSQRIAAGDAAEIALAAGSAARIFTGAPLPPGADAVLLQEACFIEGNHVQFQRSPEAGEAVRRRGSEVALDQCVLPAGARLDATDIGLAATLGIGQLEVTRRLRVALFSTGSELLEPGMPLREGAVYNSNRYQLQVLLSALGCEVSDLGIIGDDLQATRQLLREAAQAHDVLISSGGVSVGEEDHVKPAVEQEGRLQFWKIAVKPGKPLAFGEIGAATFIGLPGNPVSAFVTFVIFVRPFLLACMGAGEVMPRAEKRQAAFSFTRSKARCEFLRAQVDAQGQLRLHEHQGSAAQASLSWAHGLAVVPPQTMIEPGDLVDFLPFGQLLY